MPFFELKFPLLDGKTYVLLSYGHSMASKKHHKIWEQGGSLGKYDVFDKIEIRILGKAS